MSVPSAYLGLILIWATTPLSVKWSTEGVDYAFAVLARMLIGIIAAGLLMVLWRIPFPLHARARRAYLVSGLGLFGAMACTYWAARFIPSGLISVMFGLSPLLAAVMARQWLGEHALSREKVVGIGLGVAGLALIFLHGGSRPGPHLTLGIIAMLAAVLIYTGSMVGLKVIKDDSPPLATTVGALGVSLPLFTLLWLASSGQIPQSAPPRALAAIIYLGIFGSVVGFALYYYLIKQLPASLVALITLITPVLALLLGRFVAAEAVDATLWQGTGLILLGLALHQQETFRPLLRRWCEGET